MELATGTVLQRYTVERTLGQGGMAVVYLARHNQIGSLHAIKVLTVHSATIRERLLQEGRVQAGLKHPNIVTVTDMVEVDGAPALVLEYVRGPSLGALLRRHRPTLAQVDALARAMLKGVAAAHKQGLVHRDLKPGNVLVAVSDDGLVPKIADFGLGKLLRSTHAASVTRSGATMGTPAYMAPEQIRDSAAVDERADVFALGAMLYELLTGHQAFRGSDTLDVFEKVARGTYEPIEAVAPGVPERMRVAVERALQVDVADRPAHAGALLDVWCGNIEGLSPEPLPRVDVWSDGILATADELAPSAAESLDSEGSGGMTPDTFALSMDPEASAAETSSSSLEPIRWAEVLKWTGFATLTAIPISLAGLMAVVGSYEGLEMAGAVAPALVAIGVLGGASVGGLAALWRTGRVSRHIWWLSGPAALAVTGNLGTGASARLGMEAIKGRPASEVADIVASTAGRALTTDLIALSLVSMLLLVTGEVSAGLVIKSRGSFGNLGSNRRLFTLGLALLLGTGLWFLTTLVITQGAVPFVVFLILLGCAFGSALVSFETPDPDERTAEMRMLAILSGTLGVFAAAKVVYLQQIVGVLWSMEDVGRLEAAWTFADAVTRSGAMLVIAWGAGAALPGLVAISGPGRPRVHATTTAKDVFPLVVLLVPFIGSTMWADGNVAALTGEVVPAYVGAEVDRVADIALTDRGLMEHRHEVPGILDPAFRALERLEKLSMDELPEGAIVVESRDTVLRVDDVLIAVDGHRIADVRGFLVEVMACDCQTVVVTADRGGDLVELSLPVRATGGGD